VLGVMERCVEVGGRSRGSPVFLMDGVMVCFSFSARAVVR